MEFLIRDQTPVTIQFVWNVSDFSVGSVERDNGRVVGYDNAHDGHHRHYFGAVEPNVSFEDIEHRFEQDWITLRGRN